MTQTLAGLIKSLLTTALTGFNLFFSFESMNMASTDVETSAVPKAVAFYKNGPTSRNTEIPMAGMTNAKTEKILFLWQPFLPLGAPASAIKPADG